MGTWSNGILDAPPGLATADERHARKVSDEQLADRIEAHGMAAFVEQWEALPLLRVNARCRLPYNSICVNCG